MAARGEFGPSRVFLLSPANCGGIRARMVMSPAAQFESARQIRSADGVPLGDVFSFVSGLYFRGKLAYARRFAQPPDPADPVAAGGVLVITPNAGLRAADTRIGLDQFTSFATAGVDVDNPAYRQPLERGAHALLRAIGPDCEVVLLGSIASGKYVEVLQPIFGDRLVFPPSFVGRGDMSRGGLMLRCVAAGVELEYAPIAGAVRHGQRPPKLEPIKGILSHGAGKPQRHDDRQEEDPPGHGEDEKGKPLSHEERQGKKPLSHQGQQGAKPVAAGESRRRRDSRQDSSKRRGSRTS